LGVSLLGAQEPGLYICPCGLDTKISLKGLISMKGEKEEKMEKEKNTSARALVSTTTEVSQ